MGPVDERVLDSCGIALPDTETEQRFIKVANERFIVLVGTEISKTLNSDQIGEYLSLNYENISKCVLWVRQNATPEQFTRVRRLKFSADFVQAARALWVQKNCQHCQQIVSAAWQSFREDLRQMADGTEWITSTSERTDPM